MENVVRLPGASPRVSWLDTLWPKEHGSWSLAFEPVALGLIAAPSFGGAALGTAVAAAFFARRPLRIVWSDSVAERRAAALVALGVCVSVAALATTVLVSTSGIAAWPWTLPTVVAGLGFLNFDLRKEGREQAAEILGSFAFAWIPAVFAVVAGWTAPAAFALGAVMLTRAVPTVLVVRASVRARKRRENPGLWPVGITLAAAGGIGWLYHVGHAPAVALIAAAVLAIRAIVLLRYPRPALRASQVGMIEAILGLAFVVGVGLAF